VDKGKVQELLVTLYLRLNGYFTSGFIVHSPKKGRNRTEVDVLAVRFPANREPERQVEPAPELDPSTTVTDIVIGEVKSKGRPLQFNEGLTSTPESLTSILRWVGLFDDTEIHDLVLKLMPQFASWSDRPPMIDGPRTTRLRGLLFSPERLSRQPDERWHVSGEQVFGFIFRCLSTSVRPPACSRVYDFGQWGYPLAPIIRYFKSRKKQGPGDLQALLAYLRDDEAL